MNNLCLSLREQYLQGVKLPEICVLHLLQDNVITVKWFPQTGHCDGGVYVIKMLLVMVVCSNYG